MTRTQKRRRQLRYRKNALSVAFVLVVVICALLFSQRTALRTQAESEHEMYQYYTSVTVHSGDTLWSIADAYYTVECGDMRDYISEIKRLNHLSNDDIHSGCALVIPYYSADNR